MNNILKYNNFVILILISLSCFCPSSEAGIGVSPTVTEISVVPGTGEEGIFTVFNDSDKAVSIKVEPEDWIKRESGEENLSVSSWLKIEPLEFKLNAKEQKQIKYRVTLPKDLKGELMAMVFFASGSPGAGVTIRSRFGVALYAAAKGTEIIDAEISKVDVSKYEIDSKKEGLQKGIKFAVTVKNKGNIHIRPRGEVIIKDNQKNEIKKIDIPQGFPVFTDKANTYYALWENAAPEAGRYKVLVTLRYGGIYDGASETCQRQTAFLVNKKGEIEQ